MGGQDERPCKAFCMYTPFDPEHLKNQRMMNSTLVSQSADDIRKKLQKQNGFMAMSTVQLLEIAHQVFVNTDAVSHQEKVRQNWQNINLMATAIRGTHSKGQGKGDPGKNTQSDQTMSTAQPVCLLEAIRLKGTRLEWPQRAHSQDEVEGKDINFLVSTGAEHLVVM
ncbi:hypothetical protein AAY473_022848 [Plecturocebus cupreus]